MCEQYFGYLHKKAVASVHHVTVQNVHSAPSTIMLSDNCFVAVVLIYAWMRSVICVNNLPVNKYIAFLCRSEQSLCSWQISLVSLQSEENIPNCESIIFCCVSGYRHVGTYDDC